MNPVIIKNTKKTKKYNSKLQKKYNAEQGKIINKKKIQHTLMDSRFCSLTASLKNEKIQKDKVQSVKDWKNTKKNTKIQIAFLDAMEKYKKNTKIQGVFFIFYLYFSYFFCMFTKKTENYKKIPKNTNAIAQKYKIQKKIRINNIKNTKYKKKIRTQNFKNTKYKKKIRTQNFKNTKYKEKTNSKISQRANPVFTFGNQEPKYKKNTKPTSCIFQTLQF